MTIEETLASIDLFAELPKKDIARLADVTVERHFEKGDVIVKEGEIGIAFYIITKGSVEVLKGYGTADEHVLAARVGTGAFFGEMALFDNQLRSATVRANEPTECLLLTKWDFNAELATNARLAVALLAVLARRIRNIQDAPTH